MQKTANALKYLSMLGFVHVLFKFKYINLKSFKTLSPKQKKVSVRIHTDILVGEQGKMEKRLYINKSSSKSFLGVCIHDPEGKFQKLKEMITMYGFLNAN